MESPPPEQFGGQVEVALFSDGSFVVGDEGSLELRLFSPDGAHVLTFAGIGDGPGELRGLRSMAVTPNGDILVYGRRAVNRFNRQGHFIEREVIPTGRLPAMPPGMMRSGPNSVLPDGTVLLGYVPGEDSKQRPELWERRGGIIRPLTGAIRAPPDLSWFADLGMRPGIEQLQLEIVPRGAMGFLPFFRRSFIVGGGEPLRSFLIDTGRPNIQIVGPEGAALASFDYPHEPFEMDRSDWEAFLDMVIDDNPGDAMPREAMLEVWASQDISDTKPLIEEAFVDLLGRVWLKRYPDRIEDGSRFDIFSAEGLWIGWVETELPLSGRAATNSHFLAVERDELGVLYVKLFRLAMN